MFDVISIGAATVDIFIKSPDFVVSGNQLITPYSAKCEIDSSLISSGGGATNSSVSFARLGLNSSCLALMGNDPLVAYIFNELKANRVNTDLLIHNDMEKTDFSVILVAPDGGRTVLTNRGLSSLNSTLINWDKISLTEWFYITSVEGNMDFLEQLVGFAQEHAIKISLNPGNRELNQLNRLIPLLKYVNFLLLNGTESEMLTGLKFNENNFWEKLVSYGPPIIAVTNGRDGAYVVTNGEKLYSPIINTKPVDETGAGDSFGSAFVSALIHHLTPTDALHWGIKNSASVVSVLGAKPGLLSLEQIKI